MLRRFKEKYIGDSAFYKMLIGITLPIIIQNAMTNFVSLLDNIMVGRLGTEQMSGVSIVNTLVFVYYLFIFGGLSGVGIFTAQYFGCRDDEGIRQTFRYKLWMGFIITVAFTCVMMFYGDELIGLYLTSSSDGGNLEATLMFGMEYLGIIFFMLPAVYITQLYTSTLRECGETKVPMIAGVVAVIVNLILDYILIFGKLGAPEMGVKGAALATVISRYIEMLIVIIWCMRNKDTHTYLKGMYSTIIIPWESTKKFFITGIPLLINEGLWSIGVAMLNQAYSLRGLNVVAGLNISNTINNLFSIVFIAMGDAVAIIIGQYLGANEMERAKKEDTKIIAFSIFTSVVIGALMILFSGIFPMVYNTNDAARLIATQFIIVHAVAMPKEAFLHTSYFTIRAGGRTFITFLFDSVFILLISVPLANFLVRCTNLQPVVIFALVHTADLLKCAVGYLLIKKEVWIKNIVN